MPRTVVGYVKRYLNQMASNSEYAALEPVTNLPLATGLQAGQFQEFSDAAAGLLSSKQVNQVFILTAGSGQTPGTYTATASTGGAVIQYVVAAGGTITDVPTVINGGSYTSDVAPTFTIAAGGTPGTVAVNLGFLYTGTYMWVNLDSAITSAITVGAPLYWSQTAGSQYVVTTAAGGYPDFAGVSIDPAFGTFTNGVQNNWAWIQVNGKAKCLFPATAPGALGDVVDLIITSPGAGFVAITAGTPNGAVTQTTVGFALAAGVAKTNSLARITRAQARY